MNVNNCSNHKCEISLLNDFEAIITIVINYSNDGFLFVIERNSSNRFEAAQAEEAHSELGCQGREDFVGKFTCNFLRL